MLPYIFVSIYRSLYPVTPRFAINVSSAPPLQRRSVCCDRYSVLCRLHCGEGIYKTFPMRFYNYDYLNISSFMYLLRVLGKGRLALQHQYGVHALPHARSSVIHAPDLPIPPAGLPCLVIFLSLIATLCTSIDAYSNPILELPFLFLSFFFLSRIYCSFFESLIAVLYITVLDTRYRFPSRK